MTFGSGAGVVESALAAALLGTGDFVGGLAARARSAILIAAGVQLFELLALATVGLIIRPASPPLALLALGLAAGVAGAGGLAALYRGLALGPMGIVAGISAVGSVAIPVVFGAAVLGDLPTPLQMLGIACAVSATLAASAMPGAEVRASSVGYATVAALGFGVYIIVLHAGAAWGLWMLITTRLAAVVSLGAISATRGGLSAPLSLIRMLAFVGALDLCGNVLAVAAFSSLPVGLVAAITGMYPVATVVLAWVMLRQQPRRGGYASIALALAGIVLIGQR